MGNSQAALVDYDEGGCPKVCSVKLEPKNLQVKLSILQRNQFFSLLQGEFAQDLQGLRNRIFRLEELGKPIQVLLWQEQTPGTYTRVSDVVVIVYDSSLRPTFAEVPSFIEKVRRMNKSIRGETCLLAVVAEQKNKSEKVVSDEEGRSFCEKEGVEFFTFSDVEDDPLLIANEMVIHAVRLKESFMYGRNTKAAR